MSQLIAEFRTRKAREDEQLHEQLKAAVRAKRVAVYTDARLLDYQGSPLHQPWDHLAPLLGLMSLALLLLLFLGVAVGIVAMTLCTLTHVFGTKHFVAWRLRQRAVDYMLESPAHWQTVWQMGGVALVLEQSAEPPCLAPKGDWRKFARRNLGEPPPEPPKPTSELPPPARPAPPPPEPEIIEPGQSVEPLP
ncbi:MAG: hypothetical protein ACM31L_07745 [Actinomycetota bacterium]